MNNNNQKINIITRILAFFRKTNVKVVTGMVIGTIIYSMAVVWILDLGGFYAGGVTGISQLISTLSLKFGFEISTSFFIAIFNIPLFIIGWRGVSKRFALLSFYSVALQVVIIYVLELLVAKGFNPLASIFQNSDGSINDILTLAVLGGLVSGIGSGLSLRSGASTGGMDIISQFLSFKKNISFTGFALIVDLIIIILSAFVGTLETAIYTIIRLIIGILVLDRIHTIYKYMKVEIITVEKEAMREALINKFNHGITMYQAVGGYTNQEKWVFESVVSSYEAEEYKNIARKIDNKSFITFTVVKQVYGLFNRNAIT